MFSLLGFILLVCASVAIIVMGYLLMAKTDRFTVENQRAQEEEEEDEVPENNEG